MVGTGIMQLALVTKLIVAKRHWLGSSHRKCEALQQAQASISNETENNEKTFLTCTLHQMRNTLHSSSPGPICYFW